MAVAALSRMKQRCVQHSGILHYLPNLQRRIIRLHSAPSTSIIIRHHSAPSTSIIKKFLLRLLLRLDKVHDNVRWNVLCFLIISNLSNLSYELCVTNLWFTMSESEWANDSDKWFTMSESEWANDSDIGYSCGLWSRVRVRVSPNPNNDIGYSRGLWSTWFWCECDCKRLNFDGVNCECANVTDWPRDLTVHVGMEWMNWMMEWKPFVNKLLIIYYCVKLQPESFTMFLFRFCCWET